MSVMEILVMEVLATEMPVVRVLGGEATIISSLSGTGD